MKKEAKLNSNVGFFLLEIAKDYRNLRLSFSILPSLNGLKMDEEKMRDIIEPFIDKVMETLNKEIGQELKVRLESFLPEALDQMYLNPDMHCGDTFGKINQENADALLFMFLHWCCDLKGANAEYFMEYA